VSCQTRHDAQVFVIARPKAVAISWMMPTWLMVAGDYFACPLLYARGFGSPQWHLLWLFTKLSSNSGSYYALNKAFNFGTTDNMEFLP